MYKKLTHLILFFLPILTINNERDRFQLKNNTFYSLISNTIGKFLHQTFPNFLFLCSGLLKKKTQHDTSLIMNSQFLFLQLDCKLFSPLQTIVNMFVYNLLLQKIVGNIYERFRGGGNREIEHHFHIRGQLGFGSVMESPES